MGELTNTVAYLVGTTGTEKVNDVLKQLVDGVKPEDCKPKETPEDITTLTVKSVGREMTVGNISIMCAVLVFLIIVMALFANRFIIPHDDVDHVLPKPSDGTRTPLDLWGLPPKLKGIP